MSPVFTVEAVGDEPRTWESKHGGSFVSYYVNVSGGDAFAGEAVELTRKPESPAPQVGETLSDYELLPKKGKFPRKLKRMKEGGAPAQVNAPSPEQRQEQQQAYDAKQQARDARITRISAQKNAVALLGIEAQIALAQKDEHSAKFFSMLREEPNGLSKALEARVKFFELGVAAAEGES